MESDTIGVNLAGLAGYGCRKECVRVGFGRSPQPSLETSVRALLGLLLVALPTLLAAQSGPVASLVLEGGIEFGGELIAEVTFTDGSTQRMHAGQGGTVAVGALFRPREGSPLDVRATIGYKFVTTAAENADISLTRVPMELIATYRVAPDWTVGGGLSRHTAIHFDGGGFAPNVDFDDATGVTLELAWRGVTLSYTTMTYTDEADQNFGAGAIGLSYRWVASKRAR
jgi:hypothetical protein